jgi:hypothetical protein
MIERDNQGRLEFTPTASWDEQPHGHSLDRRLMRGDDYVTVSELAYRKAVAA